MPTKRQQQLDSNSLKTIIHHVCSDCGIIANHYTCLKRYLAPAIKPCFDVSTYKIGVCDFCHNLTQVTEVRDFFYPDFSLVPLSVGRKLFDRYGGKVLGVVGGFEIMVDPKLAADTVEMYAKNTLMHASKIITIKNI
jgi:hypothetical protein